MENDMIQKIISEQVALIQEKQNELIKNRLFDILGIELDLIEESKRRFPRIGIFHDSVDQSTHYYWNDGSVNGIRIITFYQEPLNMSQLDEFKLSINLNYR